MLALTKLIFFFLGIFLFKIIFNIEQFLFFPYLFLRQKQAFVSYNIEEIVEKMKNTKNIKKTLLLLGLLLLSATLMTAKAYTWPNLPSGPVNMTVSVGSSTYVMVTLSGVPSGYSVSNANYPAWCGNVFYDLGGGPYTVYLYSSQSSSLPQSIAGINWNEVNYILNNKQGDPLDIQMALWDIINGAEPPASYTDAWAMVNAAIANPTYQVPTGGIIGVICLTSDWVNNNVNDNSIQPLILELTAPSTSTVSTALSSSTITLGQSITDTATVTPGATGQVSFSVSTDSVNFNVFSTKTLSGGNPNTAVSDSYTPMAAGTYYFMANYSGDSNYFNSQSPNSAEPLTVTPASATIITTLNATSITLGQTIHDTAIVTGLSGAGFPAPTGSVTFWVSTDASAWTQLGSATPLTGNTATSPDYTPAAAGTYYFQAAYSGDSNYNSAFSEATAELFSTDKAVPAISTTLSQSSIVLGGSVTDTVQVTGIGGSFPSPTGTVTFQVSTDNMATWNNFGGAKTLSGGTATSDSYPPASTGTYYFRAVYSGDLNYFNCQSADNAEPLTIGSIAATVTTALNATSLPLGAALYDTATVTGLSGFPAPTGSVTFWVSTDASTWTQVGSSVLLIGNTATSTAYAPLATGTYYFQARYSGDSNYNAAYSQATSEPFTTTKGTPSILTQLSQTTIVLSTCGYQCSYPCNCQDGCQYGCQSTSQYCCQGGGTTQSASVTDKAIVTGIGGSYPNPTGTVVFQVSTDNGVTWTSFGSTKPLIGGTATSDSYKITSPGTYYFRAVYSGDSNYLSIQSGNTAEPLTVTTSIKPTTITTCLSCSGITLGKSVTDVAFVTMGATGQVVFEVSTDGTNFVQFGSLKTLSGDYMNSARSDPYTPTQTGTYYFKAIYLGNSNYQGSQSGNRDEVLTVKKSCTGCQGYSCTYWQNHQCSWQGCKPTDCFNSVFGVCITVGYNKNPTCMDALQCGSGATCTLAQQAITALLNSQCQGVNYPLTRNQIISLVQNAINCGDPSYIQSVEKQLATYNGQ